MSNKELLKSKLEECTDYQSIKNEHETKANQIKTERENKNKKFLSQRLYLSFVGVIIVLLLSSWYLQANQQQLGKKTWYAPTTSSISMIINILSSAFTALITVDLTRRI